MERDRSEIEKSLEALGDMNKASLRRKFVELYGFEPVTCSWDNLRKRVAYRLQEKAFGGLSEKTERLLDALAAADPLSALGNAPATKTTHARGARYVRVWKGRTYEVTVLGDGRFEYDGQIFASLTAVAEKITGTHWSGKRFFGVK